MKAQLAYNHTNAHEGKFGNSVDAYERLQTYYKSSGVVSHVLFGAASMYAACRALDGCSEEDAQVYHSHTMAFGNRCA